MSINGIYCLIPAFYPIKLLKTAYNLQLTMIFNSLDRPGMVD
jgi:hypothetical protein